MTPRFILTSKIEELSYHDPTIRACYMAGLMQGLTYTQMLELMVEKLAEAKAQLLKDAIDAARNAPPPLILVKSE